MNKQDVIEKMAEKSGMTKKDSERAVNAFTGVIADALAAGESVQLIGFGTFETASRSARTGRNPQTGEDVEIKAARLPKFRAGSKLKSAIPQ